MLPHTDRKPLQSDSRRNCISTQEQDTMYNEGARKLSEIKTWLPYLNSVGGFDIGQILKDKL